MSNQERGASWGANKKENANDSQEMSDLGAMSRLSIAVNH